MTELKPCPFCGGKAEKMTSSDGFTSIGCLNCNPLFGIMVQRSTEAEAIEAWNTRAERTCYDANASAREHGAHCFLWRCSNCNESYDTEMESMKFCPNCGARVVGE